LPACHNGLDDAPHFTPSGWGRFFLTSDVFHCTIDVFVPPRFCQSGLSAILPVSDARNSLTDLLRARHLFANCLVQPPSVRNATEGKQSYKYETSIPAQNRSSPTRALVPLTVEDGQLLLMFRNQ